MQVENVGTLRGKRKQWGYSPPPSKQRFPTLPSMHSSWPRLLLRNLCYLMYLQCLGLEPWGKKKTSLKMMIRPHRPFFGGKIRSKNWHRYIAHVIFVAAAPGFKLKTWWSTSLFSPLSELWVNESFSLAAATLTTDLMKKRNVWDMAIFFKVRTSWGCMYIIELWGSSPYIAALLEIF